MHTYAYTKVIPGTSDCTAMQLKKDSNSLILRNTGTLINLGETKTLILPTSIYGKTFKVNLSNYPLNTIQGSINKKNKLIF